VVTTPRSAISMNSSHGAKLSGEATSGGTKTFPVFEQRPPRIFFSLSAWR
jgi:hypothetical protein